MTPRNIGGLPPTGPAGRPEGPSKKQRVPTTIPQLPQDKIDIGIEDYVGMHGIRDLKPESLPFPINSPLNPIDSIVSASGNLIARVVGTDPGTGKQVLQDGRGNLVILE